MLYIRRVCVCVCVAGVSGSGGGLWLVAGRKEGRGLYVARDEWLVGGTMEQWEEGMHLLWAIPASLGQRNYVCCLLATRKGVSPSCGDRVTGTWNGT